jgi:hypothetical protein
VEVTASTAVSHDPPPATPVSYIHRRGLGSFPFARRY